MNKLIKLLKRYGDVFFIIAIALYYSNASTGNNDVVNVLVVIAILLMGINKLTERLKR